MQRPRKVTRKRRRILIAGEGQSEGSLVAWLQKLCDQEERRVHIEFKDSGGGDSLEVVRLAIRARRKYAHTRRRCNECLALLDSDRLTEDTKRQRDAIAHAKQNSVHAILIQPNLEGLLIRLHKGQESRQVPAEAVTRELNKLWAEYRKPATAMELATRFVLNDLIRTARHDDAIQELLQLIGVTRLQ